MPIAVVFSRGLSGVDAPLVTVEVHLGNGLPSLQIVGLPEAEVREARDRVRAALQTARFKVPPRRITVNLAPADLPKESGRYDLPIAIGILVASGQLQAPELARHELAGELALTGALRSIRGALPMARAARRDGRAFVLPSASASTAALVEGACVLPAADLATVCAHLGGSARIAPLAQSGAPAPPDYPDLADVRGQSHARGALEVAAAGEHGVLFVGTPGTGKSMLATRMPGILPPMSDDEAIETASVQSLGSGGFDPSRWRCRPVRSPHHSASAAALVGGGSVPRPGEISLATNGILFLDELPEFGRHVLETLREPLETGRIVVSRAARQAEFPARFLLVAAMNPCGRVAFFPNVRLERTAQKPSLKTSPPRTLGEHLRRRRQELGLFQSRSAELLGVCEATYIHWEKGATTPPVTSMAEIYRFLGYEPTSAAMTLPERMRRYRERHSLTIAAAARRLGVDPDSWGAWERRSKPPHPQLRGRLEALLSSEQF